MNNIKNKNALITGASKGIGRAISIELAKQGVNVAINYNKSKNISCELLLHFRALSFSLAHIGVLVVICLIWREASPKPEPVVYGKNRPFRVGEIEKRRIE